MSVYDEYSYNFIVLELAEPTVKEESEHLVDGTVLSDNGLNHLTGLLSGIDTNVFSLRKKKRAMSNDQGQEQGILDSIESVIAAGVQGKYKYIFVLTELLLV